MREGALGFVGVAHVAFGMPRAAVRALLGGPAESFRKSAGGATPDAFDELCLHVYYDSHDTCEAIELGPLCHATLSGRPIVGVPFDVAFSTLRREDPATEVTEDGARSRGLGIALYCPAHRHEPRAPVEGALIFRQGYYDE